MGGVNQKLSIRSHDGVCSYAITLTCHKYRITLKMAQQLKNWQIIATIFYKCLVNVI